MHPPVASEFAPPTIPKKRGRPSKKAQAVASKEPGQFDLLSVCIDITIYAPQNCYQRLSISRTTSPSSQKQKWRKVRSSGSQTTCSSRWNLTTSGTLSKHSCWGRHLKVFAPESSISTTIPFHGVFHIISLWKCNSEPAMTTNFSSCMLWSQRNLLSTSGLRRSLPRYVFDYISCIYVWNQFVERKGEAQWLWCWDVRWHIGSQSKQRW